MPKRVVTPKKPVELERSRTPLFLAGLLVVGLGLTAGAIAWGKSDAGEINVAATINNAHLEEPKEGETVPQAAAAEHAALPNGGLVPSDGNALAPLPEPVIEDTPSSPTPEADEDTETASEEGGVAEAPAS